ncbi:MAG TPA: lipopolysaccharide biosynthesis protein [Candidatus Manganitrophaceae bacterium]|nr:lipopolysaccharide biosynthesis protein [Candidatus Manganitrophaceae bacterium]
MKTRSIYSSASVLILGRGLSFLFTFFLPMFLARKLPPADYGTFKQIFLIFSTLYLILQAGMVQSLYYFVPREPERRATWVLQSLLVLSVTGVASGAGILFFGAKLSALFSNPALGAFIPRLALFTAVMIAASYFEAVLVSEEKVAAGSAVLFFSEALRSLFILLPLLIFHTLSGIVFGLIAFSLLRFAASFSYTCTLLSRREKPGPVFSWGTLKTQLAYSLPFGAAIVVDVLQENLHQYTVAYLFDAATFAFYSVGMLQIPIVDLFYTPMSELLIVRMGRLLREGSQPERLALWVEMTTRLALLFIPMAVYFCLIAYDLLLLFFTETYAGSVPLFRIGVMTVLLASFLTEGMLRCHAQARFFLLIPILKVLLTLLLMIPMIKLWGLLGAVVATVVVAGIGKLLMLWKIRRLMEASWSEFLPWRELGGIFFLATVIACSLAFFRETLPLPPLPALLLFSLLYWTFFGLALFFFPFLPESIRTEIRERAASLRQGAPKAPDLTSN